MGALQYLTMTRPDITYSVNQVCQFMHSPTTSHLAAVKRILQPLRGYPGFGPFRASHNLSLVSYSDANWVN